MRRNAARDFAASSRTRIRDSCGLHRASSRGPWPGLFSCACHERTMAVHAGSTMIQSHDEGLGTVLELNGSFGPIEEERLQALLRSLDPKKPVTIDFREVRLFHDLAVARLARDIGDLH